MSGRRRKDRTLEFKTTGSKVAHALDSNDTGTDEDEEDTSGPIVHTPHVDHPADEEEDDEQVDLNQSSSSSSSRRSKKHTPTRSAAAAAAFGEDDASDFKARPLSFLDDVDVQHLEESFESLQEMVDAADDLLGMYQLEDALVLYEGALSTEPTHLQALEGAGQVYLELGEPEKALEVFERCVELEPEHNARHYMNLGQLLQGMDAVEAFAKGFEIMEAELKDLEESGQDEDGNDGESEMDDETSGQRAAELRREMSVALCSAAELYLTDCCYEENAEEECGALLDQALELNRDNVEAQQLLASYRISQQRWDEAREVLLESIGVWFDPEADTNEDDWDGPSYEFRLQTVQLLIELGVVTESLQVVEQLLEQDDTKEAPWYLHAFLLREVYVEEAQEKGGDFGEAKTLWKAHQSINKACAALQRMQDDGLLSDYEDAIDQLSKELDAMVAALVEHEEDGKK